MSRVVMYRSGEREYLKIAADYYECGYFVVDLGQQVHESSHSWYECPICKAIWLEKYPADVNSSYCNYPCETATVEKVLLD